jgi:hypothetical protein
MPATSVIERRVTYWSRRDLVFNQMIMIRMTRRMSMDGSEK